jgi:RNA polymerase sigma-70 factor (ECF subfamily)
MFWEALMQTVVMLPKAFAAYAKPSSHDPSDESLIQLIARRDKRAMQALFERHNVRVYRFVLRLAGNASLAEDIVSEVFLEVWRRAGAFEGKSRVSTWLLAIARHKAYDAHRRHAATTPLDDDMAEAIIDPADNPEMAANRGNRDALIRTCLAQLSPAHREIIDLVYYHERSVKEIAQIAGIPEGTVKTRMFHARRRTAELLMAAGVDHAWAC